MLVIKEINSKLSWIVMLWLTDSRAAVPLVKNADIHVITGLLKVYLRELPEALFTDTLYPKLVEAFGNSSYVHNKQLDRNNNTSNNNNNINWY